MFQNYYLSTTGTTGSGGVFGAINYAEIYDIYCKEPSDEEYFKADFMTPDIFYDIETGRNSFYVPDLNSDRYFWTRQNTFVRILPAVELDYKIIYRPDTVALIQADGQGGDYDLDIPTEYQDLLLTLSAIEAYTDIGQVDMIQMHKNDVTEQLGVIAATKQMKEKDDDKNTP